MAKFECMNRRKEVYKGEGKPTRLSEKLGESLKIVSNYACNRSQPSLQTRHKIADILQVEVKKLLNTSVKSN